MSDFSIKPNSSWLEYNITLIGVSFNFQEPIKMPPEKKEENRWQLWWSHFLVGVIKNLQSMQKNIPANTLLPAEQKWQKNCTKRTAEYNKENKKLITKKQGVCDSKHRTEIQKKQAIYNLTHRTDNQRKQAIYDAKHKGEIWRKQAVYDAKHKTEKILYYQVKKEKILDKLRKECQKK